MVHRNNKGQILIESIFTMTLMFTLILVLQGLIKKHHIEMNKYKLSTETKRSFKNEDTKN